MVDGRRDQGRVEPGGAQSCLLPDDRGGLLDREIRARNECPIRPLIWMSQNAGATQSSAGSSSDGPSTVRTAVKSPSF